MGVELTEGGSGGGGVFVSAESKRVERVEVGQFRPCTNWGSFPCHLFVSLMKTEFLHYTAPLPFGGLFLSFPSPVVNIHL